MKLNVRNVFAATTALALVTLALTTGVHADDKPAPGQLTQESLGKLLESLSLKTNLVDTRYDFKFKANHEEAWVLSMSAVLSNDGETVWIMAWLDELPSSASDVPRVALLRLLADNDKMGNGKFFSFIPGHKRFALQRVVANRNMSTKKFRSLLIDLGKTVADTHGHWNVASWKKTDSDTQQVSGSANPTQPAKAAPAAGTKVQRIQKRVKTTK